MLQKIKALTVLAVLIALAGCMATGTRNVKNDSEKFEVGKTTMSEVRSQLGEPMATYTDRELNRTTLYYQFSEGSTDGKFLIPVVGSFLSSTQSHTETVELEFNSNNILANVGVSEINSKQESLLDAAARKVSELTGQTKKDD